MNKDIDKIERQPTLELDNSVGRALAHKLVVACSNPALNNFTLFTPKLILILYPVSQTSSFNIVITCYSTYIFFKVLISDGPLAKYLAHDCDPIP